MDYVDNFIILVLILVSHQSLESSPLSLTTDKEALVSFKSQITTQLDPNPLSTWDQNLSPCNWTGVSCDKLGQRVVGIHLSGLRMTGSISPHIGNLSFLGSLELQNNQLIRELPHQLANLVRLRILNLSSNSIRGVIPTNISQCRDLRVLDLMQNMISGKIPREISRLAHLQVLNLAGNRLSGNIPTAIRGCKSLEQLSLARNILSGPIPSTLGSVGGLEALDLSSNQLSDPSKVHLESNRHLCFDDSCEIPRENGRNLNSMYISVSIAAVISSLCFAVGFKFYIGKGKGRIDDSIEFLRQHPEMISYDELRLATKNFDEENLIGRGSFGLVYKGVVQGKALAIKVLDTTIAKSRKTFLAESAALRLLRHRNLIKLATVCSSIDSKNEEFLALVFEFMSNGSLDEWISGKRRHANGMRLNVFDRLGFVIGIASAVDYLHNETGVPVVHCDLKPSNVLLDSDMTPKVGDFGLARLLLDADDVMPLTSTHTLRGTIGYIPPEYGYGEKPSAAGDVYSYGILLLELFTGRSPTHEIFTGGLSLKSWVQMHFPTNIDQVLDFDLLQEMSNSCLDKGHSRESQNIRDCLITVLGVGLSCAAESPDARITIRHALCQLENIRRDAVEHESR